VQNVHKFGGVKKGIKGTKNVGMGPRLKRVIPEGRDFISDGCADGVLLQEREGGTRSLVGLRGGAGGKQRRKKPKKKEEPKGGVIGCERLLLEDQVFLFQSSKKNAQKKIWIGTRGEDLEKKNKNNC